MPKKVKTDEVTKRTKVICGTREIIPCRKNKEMPRIMAISTSIRIIFVKYVEVTKVIVFVGIKKLRMKAGLFFSIITKLVPRSKELNITTNTKIAGKR